MSMIAPEAESAIGLSGSQKGAGFGKMLPKPRTHHPYLVGLVLITTGGFMLIGSITGTLPSMIAALFVPTALVDSGGSQAPSGVIGSLGNLASSLNPATYFSKIIP